MSCWAQALAPGGRQGIAAGSASIPLPGAFQMCRDCWGQGFRGDREDPAEAADGCKHTSSVAQTEIPEQERDEEKSLLAERGVEL